MEWGTVQVVAVIGAALSAIFAIGVAFIAPIFSHGVKLAEFRQAWINEQRKDVAEYLGLSRRWVELWEQWNDSTDKTPEKHKPLFDLANEALVVLWRIKMRVNPLPNERSAEDAAFIAALDRLLKPPPPDAHGLSPAESQWRKLADEAVKLAQLTFKAEWEVTKKTLIRSLLERMCRNKQQLDRSVMLAQGDRIS